MGRLILFGVLFLIFTLIKLAIKGTEVAKEAGGQAYEAVFGEEKYQNKKAHKVEESTPHGIIGMLTKIAKSDGFINDTEAMIIQATIDQIVDMVPNIAKESYRQSLLKTHRDALGDRSFDSYLTLIDRNDSELLSTIVRQLIGLSIIGGMNSTKKSYILKAANYFMIDRSSVEGWISAAAREAEKEARHNNEKKYSSSYDPYKVLGVDRGESFEAIKKRYRELARKFHPDTIRAQGLDAEFINFAKNKMQEINNAFSMIKEDHGIAAA